MLYQQLIKTNYRIFTGYIGTILIGVSLIFLLPLLILPAFPEEFEYIKYFLIPFVCLATIGFLMRLSFKGIGDKSLNIQQGGVIVVLSWVIVIFFSSLPFLLGGQLNFTQSIFEAVSGWTTTGLSVVDVGKIPRVYIMWRSIMQFFGGAGLAVLMLSTVIGPHGLGLYGAEGRSEKLLPNVVKSTKIIISIYSGYAFAGIFLYIIFGMPWFDAINHSFTALSTGGFSTKVNSIGEYNNIYIELVTIILMMLGATNFGAHFLLLRGKFRRFFRIGEVRLMLYLAVISVPIISFVALSKVYHSMGESLRVGFFQTISALTTTGFSTVSYVNWNSMAIFIIIVLMLIGGSVGSTAGGIKLYRIYALFRSLVWNIKKYFLPRNIVKENCIYTYEGASYIDQNKIVELSNFVLVYLATYFLGVSVFLMNGYSLQDSMFEFASSLGTVGLSVGITNSNTGSVILWTEIIGMFLGRLEFFVIFFAVIKIFKDLKFIFSRKLAK